MALTKTVAKGTATEVGGKHGQQLLSVSVSLLIEDTDGPGFSKTVSRNFQRRSDPAEQGAKIEALQASMIEELQAAIDKYKRERQLQNHAKYATLVANIDAGLVVD